LRERMIQLVVAPELVDKWTDPWVHGKIPHMRTIVLRLIPAMLLSFLATSLFAQQPPAPPAGQAQPAAGAAQAPPRGNPKDTEVWEPVPAIVTPGKTNSDAPSDAIVLFDGTNL